MGGFGSDMVADKFGAMEVASPWRLFIETVLLALSCEKRLGRLHREYHETLEEASLHDDGGGWDGRTKKNMTAVNDHGNRNASNRLQQIYAHPNTTVERAVPTKSIHVVGEETRKERTGC